MSDNINTNNKDDNRNTISADVQNIIEQAVRHINIIIEESGLLKELDEKKADKLKATIKVCCQTAYLILSKVFNRKYYPLMNEEQEKFLMGEFIIYTVLNVIFPYTKDAKIIREMIKVYKREILDFCVDSCLLYIMDENSDVYNILNYLSETFYNIF